MKPSGLTTTLENTVFRHRPIFLVLFALMTGWMAFQSTHLFIDAGFEKQLPLKHPFMQTFLEYQEEFGGANKILLAVRAKEGDMFTPAFFEVLNQVRDDVFFLQGVNRGTVTAINTPNVRYMEIVEGGFDGGNVIPAEFQATPEQLSGVRENIIKSGKLGQLVSRDFTTAMVNAELLEKDPATGKKLNYFEVADQLQAIRTKYGSDEIDIHIIGFAKALGDIADGAGAVVTFFGIALVITFILVFLFTHSFRMTLYPLACSLIAVLWNLGLLTLFGFGMDPMSLLVPFLVFAIGVSHGVQMVNAASAELANGADGEAAARSAFRGLLLPGSVALLSDTIGFLTLLLIAILIIQELAITSTIGVLVIIFTNLILLPILLSYIQPTDKMRERLREGARKKEGLWNVLSKVATNPASLICILIAAGLTAWGLWEGRNLKIGDLHGGVPELRSDSQYNVDAAMIAEKFDIGVDILTTIVETVDDASIEHDVMDMIDRFAWEISNVPGVQSTISLPQVAKVINAGWYEGSLKWRVLPRHPQALSAATGPVESSTGLLNENASRIPVLIFTEDHKAETIDRVIAAITAFGEKHNSDRHTFRLATGNVGVMASANEVVEKAQFPMLLYIYAAVIALCLGAFRSLRATLCIVIPLSVVSILTYALMSILKIGLKVPTLPVTALGVGIGVDYGIYIFSRMKGSLESGRSLRDAYRETLNITGNAVLVTGLTLAIGTSTWIFSPLKFQADMGILLTFMFLGNMLGALLLLPAIASFIMKPKG